MSSQGRNSLPLRDSLAISMMNSGTIWLAGCSASLDKCFPELAKSGDCDSILGLVEHCDGKGQS